MDERRAISLAGCLTRAVTGDSVSVLSRRVSMAFQSQSQSPYVSSAGAVVLRRDFFTGTVLSSSDLSVSDTFSAMRLMGDREVLPKRL